MHIPEISIRSEESKKRGSQLMNQRLQNTAVPGWNLRSIKMNSLWLRNVTTLLAFTMTAVTGLATTSWAQCGDGCGASTIGSYPAALASQFSGGVPGSYLGDSFSAGDSFCGGPGGPMMPGAGDWGGGGTGYQLGGSCCGPHWYDFAIQGVFMLRDGGDAQGLMSRGIRGNAAPNIVQSTDSTDFNYEAGIRVAGRFQTSALHSIEAIYLGGLDWDDRSVVTDDQHNLYSVFSDFGNDPFGGFEDSDQASISTIDYDSELDSVELNFRRAIAPTSERFHSSLLWGFRYLRIDESLNHRITVLAHFDDINQVPREDEFTNYQIAVTNDMLGLQAGGESIVCLSPGIQFGAEGKLGVFGTNIDLSSALNSTTLDPGLVENDSDGTVSFMSDANLFMLWQFHPMFKFRAGYEMLFIQGVGTAGSNYDAAARSIATGNPLVTAGRVVDVDSNDNVFYHGLHLGFEFGW